MKKTTSLLLAACLLAGATACGALPKLAEPPAIDMEEAETLPPEIVPELTYEVTTEDYAQTATAEDGVKLAEFTYSMPRLQVYDHGEALTEAAVPAQQAALDAVACFNDQFAQWTQPEAMEEIVDSARMHYAESPSFFTGEYPQYYSEDFGYAAYRSGTLISISATLYSYLGGAHPNTDFYGWNFDLSTGSYFSVPELAEDPQVFSLAVADSIEAQAQARCKEEGWTDSGSLSDIYWTDYRAILESWSDYAVSFEQDGMFVAFSAYALAPYVAGPQLFLLPYEELAPYWSADGRAVLGLDG